MRPYHPGDLEAGKDGCLAVISIGLFISCLALMGVAGILVFLVVFGLIAFGIGHLYEKMMQERKMAKHFSDQKRLSLVMKRREALDANGKPKRPNIEERY